MEFRKGRAKRRQKMVNNRANVVMITEEDIEQLLDEWSNVTAWVKTHVTAKRPAHRYEGELLLDGKRLVFGGRDIKEGKDFELQIPLDRIINVYVGFSKDLKEGTDTAFGIGGPMPFAVRYQHNGERQTLYFNTCSDNYPPHRQINNIWWYEELDKIIAKHRTVKAS